MFGTVGRVLRLLSRFVRFEGVGETLQRMAQEGGAGGVRAAGAVHCAPRMG